MTKSTKVKKQKLKQLNQRRSVRLGNAGIAQGPSSSTSQTSPENSGQLNPGMTFGSIPSMNQLYQTPAGGTSNQRNPFVDQVGMTRSPTVTAPPEYESRRPSGQRLEYLYVPGQGFVAQEPNDTIKGNKDNNIHAPPSIETEPIDIDTPNDNESVREMTESEPSSDLNAIFHHAASIVTSTIGGENITLNQVNAINAMVTQFAANLDAAVTQLMSPRLASETESQYRNRMNAQFRFLQGNVNDNNMPMETSQTRSTVHFSPSTQGENDRTPSRPMPTTAASLRNTPENAQHIWKDRVAIQWMMNAEMRESGQSAFHDQGISFDASGNPYDRNQRVPEDTDHRNTSDSQRDHRDNRTPNDRSHSS
ncbi:hypothetical protein C8J56DRAFT_883993 [Mycena floridula]|nr:hypothetical protein C8J56DRAFT_883993 [Mycena floridula]